MLGHPAGHAFADLDAQVAESRFFAAGGNRVVEFLGLLVEHEQRPQFGVDDPLHVFEDGAQDGIKIEALGERARQAMEDKQIVERDAVFRLVRHAGTVSQPGVLAILSHAGGISVTENALCDQQGCGNGDCAAMRGLRLSADVHHGPRRLEKAGLTDVMARFFAAERFATM